MNVCTKNWFSNCEMSSDLLVISRGSCDSSFFPWVRAADCESFFEVPAATGIVVNTPGFVEGVRGSCFTMCSRFWFTIVGWCSGGIFAV